MKIIILALASFLEPLLFYKETVDGSSVLLYIIQNRIQAVLFTGMS